MFSPATRTGADEVVGEGSIEFPEISSDEGNLQVNISQSKGDDAIRDALKKAAKPVFTELVAQFNKELREAFWRQTKDHRIGCKK